MIETLCHMNPMDADLSWRSSGWYGLAVRWKLRPRDLCVVKTRSTGLKLVQDVHTKRLFLYKDYGANRGLVQYFPEQDAQLFE